MEDYYVRIVVAGLLAALIGIEREFRSKEAGLKTHFLVGVGSALIMVISKYGFTDIVIDSITKSDPSRMAAQVISGIGFLGAGTIIVEKHYIKGLTTAAGIWATSGIGLAVGAGLYDIGVFSTILVIAGVEIFNFISQRTISKIFDLDILIKTKNFYNIHEIVEEFGFNIVGFSLDKTIYNDEEVYDIKIKLKSNRKNSILSLIHQLNEQENIIKINAENI